MQSLDFDLGTTTLVGFLCDSGMDCAVKTVSKINPQAFFGADIITRTAFSSESKANKVKLCTILGDEIVNMCRELTENTDEPVSMMVMVGNPIIMGSIEEYSFEEICSNIIRVPGIGRFVGGDALAASYVLERNRNHKNIVLVDIGTNSEIVLLTDEVKLATSAAAGPALEGGNISCGVRNGEGAVDYAELTDTVNGKSIIFHTVGNETKQVLPNGVCGSGLLTLLECLVKTKAVRKDGYMLSKNEALQENVPPKIAACLGEDNRCDINNKGDRFFALTDRIRLTGNDVRNLQLAIAAIRTGIEMLLEEAKLTASVIDEICLAGAFGDKITVDSALALGMLPKIDKAKVIQSGNLAGIGACQIAVEPKKVTDVITLKNAILTVSLAEKEHFRDRFMSFMNLE